MNAGLSQLPVSRPRRSRAESSEHVVVILLLKTNPFRPSELRPGDGEPPDPVPQAERFGEEPPELHPGPAAGRPLRRARVAEATQRLPHVGGGSDRGGQEPAGLARQVETRT